MPVFEMGTDVKPAEIARQGLAKARAEDFDAIIVDTAGRLQVLPHSYCAAQKNSLVSIRR